MKLTIEIPVLLPILGNGSEALRSLLSKELKKKFLEFLYNESKIESEKECIESNINTSVINECIDSEKLKGRACYVGCDLSSKNDLSSIVLIFPSTIEGGKYEVLCRFFLPEDNMQKKIRDNNVLYSIWKKRGLITIIPRSIPRDDFIIDQIYKDMDDYKIKALSLDRYVSKKIIIDLQNSGFEIKGKRTLIQFGQGFDAMSAPTKKLEKMISVEEIDCGGNLILSWMLSNMVIVTDSVGNKKPDKEKSAVVITGVIALIVAIGAELWNEKNR